MFVPFTNGLTRKMRLRMTWEEFEEENHRLKKSKTQDQSPRATTSPSSAQPVGHMILVGMPDGTAEYRIMTEDGSLVPVEDWYL
jgi:hypothetical protein